MEKKLGVLERMKADFKGGWERRMKEEEEKLERKRLEQAVEKEKRRNERGRKKVRVREKRKSETTSESNEMKELEDSITDIFLSERRQVEGREYEEYLRRSKLAESK